MGCWQRGLSRGNNDLAFGSYFRDDATIALSPTVINLLQNRKVLVIVFALALFTMSARNVADPDVWWHLRTGQLILQNHSFFHTDPYSFTRFGQPWINHEWFSEVLLFSLYRVARFGGLIAVFGTVITTTFLLVFKRCPG